MKKSLVLICCVALAVLIIGCSRSDDEDDRYSVRYQGKEIVYLPQDVSSLPGWLLPYLQDSPSDCVCIVCIGTKDGETVYNVYDSLSSSLYGWFFDKDGKSIDVKGNLFEEIKDWKCIYFRRSSWKE